MYALNRGEVSKLALARVDVERLRLSMDVQLNMCPRVVGAAALRPGLEFLGVSNVNAAAKYVPFVFASDDTAALELTSGTLRVWLGGTTLVQRPAHSSVINAFGNTSEWTIISSGGGATGVCTPAGSPTAVLQLKGNSEGNRVTAHSYINVAVQDRLIEHAVRVVVNRGPVKFRVGTIAGLDDVFRTTSLDTGYHSLAFTPLVGQVWCQFESAAIQTKEVGSIGVEAAGILTVPTPWATANLPDMRWEQSADVVYIACKGVRPYKIERRSKASWSVAQFNPDDGPFGINGDSAIKLKPSNIVGDITLSADRPLFDVGHNNALFRVFHTGQNVIATLGASDTYTDVIRVSGVSQVRVGDVNVDVSDRNFTLSITGTFTGTLTLQRSLDGPDTGFTDFKTYASPFTEVIRDGLNNIIAWYRLGFKPAAWGSGSAVCSLSYSGGGGTGVCRITRVIDSQTCSAEVLRPFLNNTYSAEWKEGEWSDLKGYPSAVALHEGRLWFAGADRIWGSVSDAYTSFDYDKEGDAGTINRSIGKGPISNISWLMSLNRLVIGADTSSIGARSSSFDEPLTPKNFNLKDISTNGASRIPSAKIDTRGLYVQQGGRRVYEITWDVALTDYKARDMTRLNEDIGKPGFVAVAIQRQPDTMIHFIRNDGQAAVLLYDLEDQVEAWWRIATDGVIEDALVLPGVVEDKVFYLVRRTVNGTEIRCWELFAKQSETVGNNLNLQADSFIWRSSPVTTTTTLYAGHLVGKTVVMWGDGKDLGTAVVASDGYVTLPEPCFSAMAGLYYEGEMITSKLAYAAAGGSAINHQKKVGKVGFQLADTHAQGILYGQYLSTLDNLPLMERGAPIDQNAIWSDYDENMIEIAGQWHPDARLHFKCFAPRPATVMGVTIGIDTSG